jgi:polar amino acid transport system substrate-binding protein
LLSAALGGLAVAAGLAGAVAWLRPRGEASWDRVRSSGVLRVGYAVEAPYAFVEADGRVSGESPEVARELGRRLGLELRWVNTAFHQLIPELEAGRFDLIAAGLFVTPERARRVHFARPQLLVRSGWLTLAGNPQRLGPYATLRERQGLRLAVLNGSVEQTELAALGLAPGALLAVPDAGSGRAAVLQGQADGLALSLPTVAQMAQDHAGRLQAVPAAAGSSSGSRVAMALRPADTSLAAAVDSALAGYIGSPPHLALLQRFGLSQADLPPGTHDASR